MSFLCNFLELHVVTDLLLPSSSVNDIVSGSCLNVICIEILIPLYTDMQFSTNLKPRHPKPSKLMNCVEFVLQLRERG